MAAAPALIRATKSGMRSQRRYILKLLPMAIVVALLRCDLQPLPHKAVGRPNVLAGLAPYQTEHIHRFGDYTLNFGHKVPPMDFKLRIIE